MYIIGGALELSGLLRTNQRAFGSFRTLNRLSSARRRFRLDFFNSRLLDGIALIRLDILLR